jgi:ATP-dependent protease HslVU (ClpYQ) peptidase subunit
LLVEALEKILAMCSDQLAKMRSDLAMKDHQLALKDWQLVLQDRRVTDLEAFLINIHKSHQK